MAEHPQFRGLPCALPSTRPHIDRIALKNRISPSTNTKLLLTLVEAFGVAPSPPEYLTIPEYLSPEVLAEVQDAAEANGLTLSILAGGTASVDGLTRHVLSRSPLSVAQRHQICARATFLYNVTHGALNVQWTGFLMDPSAKYCRIPLGNKKQYAYLEHLAAPCHVSAPRPLPALR